MTGRSAREQARLWHRACRAWVVAVVLSASCSVGVVVVFVFYADALGLLIGLGLGGATAWAWCHAGQCWRDLEDRERQALERPLERDGR